MKRLIEAKLKDMDTENTMKTGILCAFAEQHKQMKAAGSPEEAEKYCKNIKILAEAFAAIKWG